MQGAVKIAFQALFLVGFIYLLAALVGAAPGMSVKGPNFRARVGKGNGCGRGGHQRPRYENVATGMVGDLIQSQGSAYPPAGMPQISW